MRRTFTLVDRDISDDSTEALRELLDLAERKELIGVAFIAMLTNRRYFADAVGECARSPTFTRGAVRALDDDLALKVRSRRK